MIKPTKRKVRKSVKKKVVAKKSLRTKSNPARKSPPNFDVYKFKKIYPDATLKELKQAYEWSVEQSIDNYDDPKATWADHFPFCIEAIVDEREQTQKKKSNPKSSDLKSLVGKTVFVKDAKWGNVKGILEFTKPKDDDYMELNVYSVFDFTEGRGLTFDARDVNTITGKEIKLKNRN